MRILFAFLLFIGPNLILSGQNQPEIRGTLSTGELLTGVYNPDHFVLGISYVWELADNQAGTEGVKEVGKAQTYRIKQEDAGRYIRLEVTTVNLFGRKTIVYSSWQGPIRHSIPLIQGTVTISGTLKVGQTANVNYVYNPNNYQESGTTFSWYSANDPAGSGAALLTGNGSSLPLSEALEGKYIRVEVIPKDINGNSGATYTSSWYGPVEKVEVINNAPRASNVRIRGNPVYCGVLTGSYEYSDPENDVEGGTSLRWLRAPEVNDVPVAIPNATSNTYTVTTADKGMYIYFEVTPRAVSGITTGTSVMSNSTSLIQGDLPTVTFSGNASICEGTNTTLSLTFTGNPPFKLEYTNGVKTSTLTTSNYNYQLTVNTGGTYKGTKLTDVLNCPVTNLPSTAVISSKPSPNLNFSVAATCYTGDTTLFRNESSSRNTIRSWSWNFGDASSPVNQNVSSLETPKHKYAAPGNYKVVLAAENTEGCRDTVIKNITLGEKPGVDLTWNKECFSTNMNVTFLSTTNSTAKIAKYLWSIRNSGSLVKESTSRELNHSFTSTGLYDVKLKVVTDLGCADSISKSFSPKNVIGLQNEMYSDDFEGNNNWSVETSFKNNWQKGDPPGALSAHSGNNAFYTIFPETRKNQQMIINSSCFDFTGLQTPFVEMWVNYNHQESKEGVVLQYMQDGSSAWTTVGGLNSGFNWYNYDNITSKPGNSQIGWSGNSNGWKLVRHGLTLSNKTNVRFRLVYASASDANAYDGFAFDDVFIGQRGKKALVEYFTNLSDAFASQSNFTFDSVMNSSGTNAIRLQYHTAFPGIDSLNEDNKANPSARALYYGVGKVPVSFIDGGSLQNFHYDFSTKKMNANDIINRSFDDPRFNIKITSGILDNTVTGNVKLTALRNLSGLENILHIVIVEDVVSSIAGKTITMKNVVKYMYPSAGGSLLSSSWAKDQSLDIPFSWTLANVYNKTKTKVVAFIQDNQTKEVYQSEIAANSAITSNRDLGDVGKYKLYPNPASNKVWINFGKETEEPCNIQIITPTGKIAGEYSINRGVSKTEISLADLPTGMYYVKISSDGKEVTTEKLIVRTQ